MKRTIIAILISLAAALPAKAGEGPSKADMLKGLLVVGVYSRICPTPLSDYAKAQTLAVLRMFGDLDSDFLERSVTAYRDSFKPDDIDPRCGETAKTLSATGVGVPAEPQS